MRYIGRPANDCTRIGATLHTYSPSVIRWGVFVFPGLNPNRSRPNRAGAVGVFYSALQAIALPGPSYAVTGATMTTQRETAMRAARWELRQRGAALTVENAERALDDIARADPDKVAAVWWRTATDRQWRLFCREWPTFAEGQ